MEGFEQDRKILLFIDRNIRTIRTIRAKMEKKNESVLF